MNSLSGEPRLEDEEIGVNRNNYDYLIHVLRYHTLFKIDNTIQYHQHKLYEQNYLKFIEISRASSSAAVYFKFTWRLKVNLSGFYHLFILKLKTLRRKIEMGIKIANMFIKIANMFIHVVM